MRMKDSPLRQPPDEEDITLEIDEWIAECQSLHPNLSLGINIRLSAWDSLVLLYILSHIGQFFWITDDLHKNLSQRAYQNNYEGEWKTVQDFLESDLQTPKKFYDKFVENRDPCEFFGNIKRRAKVLLRIIKKKKRDFQAGNVIYPIRKRGYKDKGTLRPFHRPAVIPPYSEVKVDRRSDIFHPLIKENRGEEIPEREDQLQNHRKE